MYHVISGNWDILYMYTLYVSYVRYMYCTMHLLFIRQLIIFCFVGSEVWNKATILTMTSLKVFYTCTHVGVASATVCILMHLMGYMLVIQKCTCTCSTCSYCMQVHVHIYCIRVLMFLHSIGTKYEVIFLSVS